MKSFCTCLVSIVFLGCFGVAQDAGSPSAGGSIATDLSSPMSNNEIIRQQSAKLDKISRLIAQQETRAGKTGNEATIGDIEELTNAYVKTRERGIDISPEDFLALRAAIRDMASTTQPQAAQVSPYAAIMAVEAPHVAPNALNKVASDGLIVDKSPAKVLMNTFQVANRNAKDALQRAKNEVMSAEKQQP